ncbi:hypothetical protein CH63R_05163 [Colletotrichum higginsianum IMI 349063]|uniref:Uncharacterized protein n=1 Tax=Colletotrichum higginsianum (strain IMI 349063) TaxID=759273 RepID=A0A1B7YLE3_COLHI|nr:hypothetical protein CH63R_05163 [Colletotrichum higginsianum IMI 349063]OBR12867.1 hypothetical protein CH63R_05163 [Colletotrichum higginsianum IMI 349063]
MASQRSGAPFSSVGTVAARYGPPGHLMAADDATLISPCPPEVASTFPAPAVSSRRPLAQRDYARS